jgi:tetratricopeptide (TPR) repeat protein
LARDLEGQGRLDDAIAAGRRFLGLLEDEQEFPGRDAARSLGTQMRLIVGRLQVTNAQLEAARETLEHALALAEQQHRAEPDSEPVIVACNYLGGLYLDLGQLQSAREHLTRGAARVEARQEQDRGTTSPSSHGEGAAARYDRALESMAKLVRVAPTSAKWQDDLVEIVAGRFDLAVTRGDGPQAAAHGAGGWSRPREACTSRPST